MLNGGTVGAGGTGNLGEGSKIGVARMTYATGGSFAPLAADLVEIDPGNGLGDRRSAIGSTSRPRSRARK